MNGITFAILFILTAILAIDTEKPGFVNTVMDVITGKKEV